MFRYKWIGFVISVSMVFNNLGFDPGREGFKKGKKHFKIRKIARMDFLESSGLQHIDSTTFWTHNDSGGSAELFKFNYDGIKLDKESFDLKNVDWEDITEDESGNLYIGDFGNNSNSRKDLTIYKIGEMIETITFKYPDQDEFPPSEDNMNFDCEAFYWLESNLYLISKNRGNKIVKVYSLTDQPGFQTAELIDQIKLKRMVTAADINPSQEQIAILTYGMVHTFKLEQKDLPFSKPLLATKFSKGGQAEGITYINDEELLISNESGKLFLMKPRRKN